MNIVNEVPGLAITATRYGMTEHIDRKVSKDEPVVVELAAFVGHDILDGAVLSKFNSDTPMGGIGQKIQKELEKYRLNA